MGLQGLEEAWRSTGGRGDKEVGEAAGTQKYQEGPGGGQKGGTATRWWGESIGLHILVPFPHCHPHFSTTQGLLVILNFTKTA